MSKTNKFQMYSIVLVFIGVVSISILCQWFNYSNYYDIYLIRKDNVKLLDKQPELMDVMSNISVRLNGADVREFVVNREYISIPGSNKNRTVFVMNTIYLPDENIVAIFLLGPRLWYTSDAHHNYYQNIKNDWDLGKDKLYCLFEMDKDTFYETQIIFVPEVLYSEHRGSTVILLCKIPNQIVINPKRDYQKFVLYSKDSDNGISLLLSFNIRNRTIIPLRSKRRNIGNGTDFLTACIPSIKEPIPWITENIAYLVSQGIQHIYIGTFFNWRQESNTNELIKMLQPWYDKGLISLFNFVMPEPLRITNRFFAGQPQFLIQCLYLAKSFGDEFTLNVDADEFLVFHNRQTIYNQLSTTYYNSIKNKCWIVFPAYNAYNLTNINSNYLVPRYTTIESPKLVDFYDRCKTLWNVKYLWSVEVHAGGACNINGFNWNEQIANYKHTYIHEHKRKRRRHNSTYLVKIMDGEYDASIRHYNNAIKPREICANKTINDSYTTQYIWNNIQNEFNKHNFNYTTFNNNTQKYNILFSKYYINLFGKMSPMNKSVYIGCKNPKRDRSKHNFFPIYYLNVTT